MKNNFELTNDPFKNIVILIPMLSDESRQAVSYLIQGCLLGEQLAKAKLEAEINSKEH